MNPEFQGHTFYTGEETSTRSLKDIRALAERLKGVEQTVIFFDDANSRELCGQYLPCFIEEPKYVHCHQLFKNPEPSDTNKYDYLPDRPSTVIVNDLYTEDDKNMEICLKYVLDNPQHRWILLSNHGQQVKPIAPLQYFIAFRSPLVLIARST